MRYRNSKRRAKTCLNFTAKEFMSKFCFRVLKIIVNCLFTTSDLITIKQNFDSHNKLWVEVRNTVEAAILDYRKLVLSAHGITRIQYKEAADRVEVGTRRVQSCFEVVFINILQCLISKIKIHAIVEIFVEETRTKTQLFWRMIVVKISLFTILGRLYYQRTFI